MLMILARLVRSESFWAVVKVRSPHTGPEVCYIIAWFGGDGGWRVAARSGFRLHRLGRRHLRGIKQTQTRGTSPLRQSSLPLRSPLFISQ